MAGICPTCGCHYSTNECGIHFCPMHAAAEQLLAAVTATHAYFLTCMGTADAEGKTHAQGRIFVEGDDLDLLAEEAAALTVVAMEKYQGKLTTHIAGNAIVEAIAKAKRRGKPKR
jgi:hypothetical protein